MLKAFPLDLTMPLTLPDFVIFQPHTWILLYSLYDELIDYLEYRLFYILWDLDFGLIHLPVIIFCAILVNVILIPPFLLLLLANTVKHLLTEILSFRPWRLPMAWPWQYPSLLVIGLWHFVRHVYVETAWDMMLSIIPSSYRPRGIAARVFGGTARWASLLLVIVPVLLLGPITRLGWRVSVYLFDNS